MAWKGDEQYDAHLKRSIDDILLANEITIGLTKPRVPLHWKNGWLAGDIADVKKARLELLELMREKR